MQHTNSVVVDYALGLGLCCGHSCRADARGEESAQERNVGQLL